MTDQIGGSQIKDMGQRTTLLFLHHLLFSKPLGNSYASLAG